MRPVGSYALAILPRVGVPQPAVTLVCVCQLSQLMRQVFTVAASLGRSALLLFSVHAAPAPLLNARLPGPRAQSHPVLPVVPQRVYDPENAASLSQKRRNIMHGREWAANGERCSRGISVSGETLLRQRECQTAIVVGT